MVVLEADSPRSIVVFGSGAGGEPRRCWTPLEALGANGSTVLAPRSEWFDPRTVTAAPLRDRVQALKTALAQHGPTAVPVIAVGHSIGGCAVLCLAGAQPSDRDGRPLTVPTQQGSTRLVLVAPATGWFGAPGALAGVRSPMTVVSGARDDSTPPSSAEVLRTAPVAVDVHVVDDAGHVDVVSDPPPGTAPSPGLDRAALVDLVARATVV